MTATMEKVWNEYEAEKATGNAETAELIGDVYTVLDMLDSGADAEENRDFFEKTYYGMSAVAWKIEKFHPGRLFEIRMACENALVEAGILEADENRKKRTSTTAKPTGTSGWPISATICTGTWTLQWDMKGKEGKGNEILGNDSRSVQGNGNGRSACTAGVLGAP